MKLLKLTAVGLPLFKEKLELSFIASQRVNEDTKDKLFRLNENYNYYVNNVNAVIGINASGKTSVLKVILLALNILDNEPLNHCPTVDILGEAKEAVLDLYFISNNDDVCRLRSVISYSSEDNRYYFKDEQFWIKPLSGVKTKKELVDFNNYNPFNIRNSDEAFLADDTSIIIAYNKTHGQRSFVVDLLFMTNYNILGITSQISPDVIRFLDPTIEDLKLVHTDTKTTVKLKFYGKDWINLPDYFELDNYLSSGTIKGISIFTVATEVFKRGGYMIVDELENHFNHEIVATLIKLFMNSSVNKKGGTLIFSTHYPEILDEFDRNDSITITRNRNGITAENLSDILKRNDIKKSDAYQSGYLDGTVPAYEAYAKLKNSIKDAVMEG